MKITNAMIKNAWVGFDENNVLSAFMTFEGQDGSYDCTLSLFNPVDTVRLSELMHYTGAREFSNLNGKIIRKVTVNGHLYGFGHPIENRFIPTCTNTAMEICELQFKEILSKYSR